MKNTELQKYSEPHIVPELWWWISKIETKFGGFGNRIPDNYVKQLIKKLRKVQPFIQKYGKESERDLWDSEWVDSLEEKMFKDKHMRNLEFDMVKGIIHKNLILRSHKLNKPEFWNYREPYYNHERDGYLRDSRTGKRV